MSRGLCSSIDFIKNGINKASNTKNAIIFISDADKKIKRKFKEKENKEKQGKLNENFQEIQLDFNEVERIVLPDGR